MAVTQIGGASALTLQSIADMRTQLSDLQRQLGSGKIATDYAGIGLDRGLTIGLRSQLSAIAGYQHSITQVGVRLELMQTSLNEFDSAMQKAKGIALQTQYLLNGATQTQDQRVMGDLLDQMMSALNVGVDGRYLFSGRAVSQVPVETIDRIMNGDGLRAGLKQLIDERRQADLGTSGLGRLVISAPTATSVSLTEDAVSPFGFKLVGATSTVPGVVVTGPVGAPADLNVDLGAASPVDGQMIRFSFTLPDGSIRDLTMKATSSVTPGENEFTIGGAPAITAANLQSALNTSLAKFADTELVAASAMAAGAEFFNAGAASPPQRVAGPPFDTATALVAGTSANTVTWYLGDDDATDPRSTAISRVDTALTASYGARANEEALRTTMQSVAVFAAVEFSGSNPNGYAQYSALRQRLTASLTGSPNVQKVSDIGSQLAAVQVVITNAKDRHQQSDTTLRNLLDGIEGAPTEEVAAQILTLQTNLQATLQTTAMLLQTNILKYL